jgi:hypothetical protein
MSTISHEEDKKHRHELATQIDLFAKRIGPVVWHTIETKYNEKVKGLTKDGQPITEFVKTVQLEFHLSQTRGGIALRAWGRVCLVGPENYRDRLSYTQLEQIMNHLKKLEIQAGRYAGGYDLMVSALSH